MCGILGIVTFRGEAVMPEQFDRALAQLHHRGPDDHGSCHTTTTNGARVSLGQTRLSILDLSEAGHQPMFSPRTGACIVYNGEAYNFRAVRDDLQKRGLIFASECDTEVILAAYDEHGDAFIDPFHGMFAMCIHDVRRNRLMLLRDRLGIKPLYYYWDGVHFAFSSEVTALAALPGLNLDVSPYAIRQFLLRGYIPHPHSIFENVHKLPAGHRLTLDLNHPSPVLTRYWDSLDFYARPQAFRDEKEVVDAIDERLRQAVKLRLISDVPLGAFLSGGIDSSLVVSMMRQVHTGRVRTFSIGFSSEAWNEAPAARRIADHLSTEHEEFYLTEQNILDAARTAADHYDEPFADPSNIPTLALARLTRQFVTVALSGDGGDELFWGYTSYYSNSLKWFQRSRLLPLALRRPVAALFSRRGGHKFNRLGAAFAAPDLNEFFNGPVLWNPIHDPDLMRDSISGNQLIEIGRRVMDRLHGAPVDVLTGAFDVQSYLVDDILTKVDRATMAVALEARVPIIDHKVVELAAGIPIRFKTSGREPKHLLKVLLERYLPRPLWDRPKKGFGVPLVDWFRSTLKEWLHDELLGAPSRLHDWLSRSALQQVLDDHQTGRADRSGVLWACVQLAGWDRRIRSIQAANASPNRQKTAV